VFLNDQWRLSTNIPNPDSSLYDGVYESYSNYKVPSSCAIMTINISELDTFTLYIRSYGESNYDYVMVSQLDKTIDQNTSYLYSEDVKAHTRGVQLSSTDIYSYTPVTFSNIGGGEHTITVIYRKDSSGDSYDDMGYVLISKDNASIDEPEPDIPEGDEGINIDNYLTIEALEDGLTASLSTNACEYCIDGDNNWITIAAGQRTPLINQGQTISFRGTLQPSSTAGIGTFTINKACNLKGNCMSMLFGDNAAKNFSLAAFPYAYYKLFYNCTAIKSISETFLPAMALSNYCYGYMFYGCSNLTNAPNLPAYTLTSSCYYYMYRGCISLTNPGIISATTLATYCCYGMYYGCTALTTAPDLLAETMVSYCYYYMFSNCSKLNFIKTYAINKTGYYQMYYWTNGVSTSGTFYKHPDATWGDTGTSGIPNGWTLKYISMV
jgi:hypothetical protein